MLHKKFRFTKLHDDEYKGLTEDEIETKYETQTQFLKQIYQPVSVHKKWSYLLITFSHENKHHYEINRIQGYLPSKLIMFVIVYIYIYYCFYFNIY